MGSKTGKSGEFASKLFGDIRQISVVEWKRNPSDKANSNDQTQARQGGTCRHPTEDACQADMLIRR